MNLGFRQLITVLAALLPSIIVPAQDIPVLPDDPAVLKGVMPNGMSYYVVSNPTVKGMADFVLVQKTGSRTVPDSSAAKAASVAEESLSHLKRLPSSSYEFFSRHGITPERGGFFKVTDDATVFRFPDVRLNNNVTDSTLLVIMDMADRANYAGDEHLAAWYTPSDQAVIVSGDIDAKSVAERLRSMSYMTPAKESSTRPEYVNPENTAAGYVRRPLDKPSLVEISASWTSGRVPREYMNTVQPEIFEMTLHTLGDIAVGRIRKALKDIGVPVAEVSYDHVCSSVYPYDDSFSICAVVAAEDADRAMDAVSGVMASISWDGVTKDEYVLAEMDYMDALSDEAAMPFKSNHEYVDRCMNAFLYNSSLASPKERLSFHSSRNLPDTMRQRLFNDIAKALLNNQGAGLREPGATGAKPPVNVSDTADFPDKGAKTRLRSAKKEPVSGGTVWTFSNGFKVIYKRMPSDRLYYNLALNGGFGSISGIESGEGAFVSDYLKTCSIGGMSAEAFMDILKMEGISMDFTVYMSNLMISGDLPEERISLLLRALLAVANERTGDDDAFRYYKESEYLALDKAQGSFSARMTAIDSIMCPDYRYSKFKVRMTDGFQNKAEAYFDSQFSKMNDGALILVGNLEEEALKKMLMSYVGGFRTSNAAVRRPVVRYHPVSGWSTYTVEGGEDIIEIVISARVPLTMENYMASELAVMLLERRLAVEFNDSEIHLSMTHDSYIYPEERLNLLISVSGASLKNLADIRSALSDLHLTDISDGDLKPLKGDLKNRMALKMKTPPYWVDAIALRYLDGKDMSSNYAARIDAVTPAKVLSILGLLDEGSKVEYITSKE